MRNDISRFGVNGMRGNHACVSFGTFLQDVLVETRPVRRLPRCCQTSRSAGSSSGGTSGRGAATGVAGLPVLPVRDEIIHDTGLRQG